MGAIQQVIMGHGGSSATSYNSLVTTAAPDFWWKLDETSGTTAVSSGSLPSNDGAISGGATWAGSGVSIAAPTGYAGLGTGIDMSAASVTDIRLTPGNSVAFGGSSTSSWGIGLWVAGSAGSQYLASRQNQAAIIYNFVANTVEFFSIGYSGTDPRTGSQITLSSSDTTTPHQIWYVYDNGTWAGYLDGVNVFSVSRSFGTPVSNGNIYLGSDSSGSTSPSRFWDFLVFNRAPTATEIANFWAARNV